MFKPDELDGKKVELGKRVRAEGAGLPSLELDAAKRQRVEDTDGGKRPIANDSEADTIKRYIGDDHVVDGDEPSAKSESGQRN